MPVKIEIKGQKEMEAAFKKSPQIVKAEIDIAIRKSLLSIQAKATPKVPTDTGFLRNSWSLSVGSLKGELENTAPYAAAAHDGSKPHFPPLQAIERWAERHGIPPFLVARAISKKGTKGVPFLDDGAREAQISIDGYFDSALKNITNKLAT